MGKLVRRLLSGNPRQVDALMTAVVGPNKKGGWSDKDAVDAANQIRRMVMPRLLLK